jgi:4-diphosphocytidyl-2-C-methyl-D-erythritol kinase
MTAERAYAKLNLVLQVGAPRPDGMHPVCSIFASIDLADEVEVTPAAADGVRCPGVDGPNLAAGAVEALRGRVPSLPPLAVRIEKRIPVAAGLGGGSADAAAVLRAANRIASEPLDAAELRELAAELGSDVPSQVEPGHAIVQGAGEVVEPIELPRLGAVLVPQADGLATAEVYAQLDRMRAWRERLDPDRLRDIAARGDLPTSLDNDLEPAALALRPELAEVLQALRAAGAPGALVSGSGPTCFGLFPDRAAAEAAAARIPGAIVAALRAPSGLP